MAVLDKEETRQDTQRAQQAVKGLESRGAKSLVLPLERAARELHPAAQTPRRHPFSKRRAPIFHYESDAGGRLGTRRAHSCHQRGGRQISLRQRQADDLPTIPRGRHAPADDDRRPAQPRAEPRNLKMIGLLLEHPVRQGEQGREAVPEAYRGAPAGHGYPNDLIFQPTLGFEGGTSSRSSALRRRRQRRAGHVIPSSREEQLTRHRHELRGGCCTFLAYSGFPCSLSRTPGAATTSITAPPR